MRKFLLLLFVPLLLACEGPMGPPGQDGRNGLENYWSKTTIHDRARDWQERYIPDEKNEKEYYAGATIKNFDELDFDEGVIIAYRVFGNTKQALPYSMYYEGPMGLWLETVNFTIGRDGYVEFSIANNGGYLPEDTTFEIIITGPGY